MFTKHTFSVLNSGLKPLGVKSSAVLRDKEAKQQSTFNFPLHNQKITCCAQLDTSKIFYNYTFDKGRLKTLVSWSLKTYGEYKTINLLENLKKIGFESATKAGISLGIEDLKIPPKKALLLYEAEEITKKATDQYNKAEITGVERFQRLIDTWHRTSEQLKQEVIDHFEKTDVLNPVYMMAFSGARGNISQVRQLVGMRGLMADAKGQIIDYPIRSNFREGLTLTEYIISSYGARKGIVDTALRTANAGYLTRRLVDVAQHVVISNYDCGTKKGIFLGDMKEGTKTIYSLQTRLIGRVLARDVYKASPQHDSVSTQNVSSPSGNASSLTAPFPTGGLQGSSLTNDFKKQTRIKLALRNQEITPDLAFELTKNAHLSEQKVFTRSPLTCETKKLICQLCYGWSLAQGNLVSIGEAVGIVAAQSIGEPGTQLTMRTFHTGGVFSGDISDQIRAPYKGKVHYFEQIAGTLIRTPEGKMAFLTKVDGSMCVYNKDTSISEAKIFKIPAYTILYYKSGDWVIEKQVIAQISTIARQQNMRDDSELTVKSQIQGQFFVKTLQIQEKYIGPKLKTSLRVNQSETSGDPENTEQTNPLLMTKIMASWDWGYAWILSCRLYKIPIFSSTEELKLVPQYGDFVDRNSVMSKIKWIVPSHGGNLNYVDIYSDTLAKSNSNSFSLTKQQRNPFSTTKKDFVKKPNTLFTNINLKKNLLQLQINKITYNKIGYFVDNPNLFIFLPNNLKGLNSTQTNFNTRSQIFNKNNSARSEDTLLNNSKTKHTFNLFKPARELSDFFGIQVFPKASFLNSYVKSFGYDLSDKKSTGLLTSETIFALNYKGLVGSIQKYRSTAASLPCLADKLNSVKSSSVHNNIQKQKSGGLAVIINQLKNKFEVKQSSNGFTIHPQISLNSKDIKATKQNKELYLTTNQEKKLANTNYQNYLIFCYANVKNAKLVTLQKQILTKSLFNNLEFALKSSNQNQQGKVASAKSNQRQAKIKDRNSIVEANLELTRSQKYFGKQVWSDGYSGSNLTVDNMVKANSPKSTKKLNLNKTTKSFNIAHFWKNKVSTNTLTQSLSASVVEQGKAYVSYSLFNNLNLLNNGEGLKDFPLAFNGVKRLYPMGGFVNQKSNKTNIKLMDSKKAISRKGAAKSKKRASSGRNNIKQTKSLIKNSGQGRIALSKAGSSVKTNLSHNVDNLATHFNCLGFNWLEYKGKLGGFVKLATPLREFETTTINSKSGFTSGQTELPIVIRISRKSFKQCISFIDSVGFANGMGKTGNKLSSKFMQKFNLTKDNPFPQGNTNLLLQNKYIFVGLKPSIKQTTLQKGAFDKTSFIDPLPEQKQINTVCFTNLSKNKNIEIMIWLLKRLKTFTSFFTSVLVKAGGFTSHPHSFSASEKKLANKEKQTAAYYNQKQLLQNNLKNFKTKAIKGISATRNLALQTKITKAFDLLNSNHFVEAFNGVKSQYIKQESLLTLSKTNMVPLRPEGKGFNGVESQSNKILLQRIINLFLSPQVFANVAFKPKPTFIKKAKVRSKVEAFKHLQKAQSAYQVELKKVFQVGKKIKVFSLSVKAFNFVKSQKPNGYTEVKPSQFIYKTFNLNVDKQLTNSLGLKKLGNSFSLAPCIFDKQLIYSLSNPQSNVNTVSQVIKASLDYKNTVNQNSSNIAQRTKLNADSNIQKKADAPKQPGLIEWVDTRFNKGKNKSKDTSVTQESLPKLHWFVNPKTPRFLPSEFIKVLPSPANPKDSSILDSKEKPNIKSNYLNFVKVHELNAHGKFISKNISLLLNYNLKSENKFVGLQNRPADAYQALPSGGVESENGSRNKSTLPGCGDKQNNLTYLTSNSLDLHSLHQELLHNKASFDLHLLNLLKISGEFAFPSGQNHKKSATRTSIYNKVKSFMCGLKRDFKRNQQSTKTISVVFKSNSGAFVKPLSKLENNSKTNFQNLSIFNKQVTNYAVSPISKVPNAHLVILPYLKDYGLLANSNDKVGDALRYDLIQQQKAVLNSVHLNTNKLVKPTKTHGVKLKAAYTENFKHKEISNILLNYNKRLDKTVKKTNIYKSLEQLSRLNNPYVKLIDFYYKTNQYTSAAREGKDSKQGGTLIRRANLFPARFDNQKIKSFLTNISNLNKVASISSYYKSKQQNGKAFNSLKTKELTTNKAKDLRSKGLGLQAKLLKLHQVLNRNSLKNPHFIILTDLEKFCFQNPNNKLNAQSFIVTYNLPSGVFDYQFKKVDVNLNHLSNSNIILANLKQVLKESFNNETQTNPMLPNLSTQFESFQANHAQQYANSLLSSKLNAVISNYINLSNISRGLTDLAESNVVFMQQKTTNNKQTRRQLINTYLNYNPSFTNKKTLLALFNIVCFELNLILKLKNYKYGFRSANSDHLSRTKSLSNLHQKFGISGTTLLRKSSKKLGIESDFNTVSNVKSPYNSAFKSSALNYFNTNWFLTKGDQSSQNTEIPAYFKTRLRVCFDNINYSLNSLINTSFLSSYAGEIIKQPIFKNNNYIFNQYYKSLTSDFEQEDSAIISHQKLLELKNLELKNLELKNLELKNLELNRGAEVELVEQSSNYPFIQKQAITNNKQRCLVLTKNDLITYNFTLNLDILPLQLKQTQLLKDSISDAQNSLKPTTVIKLWSKQKNLSFKSNSSKLSFATETKKPDIFLSAPRFKEISPAKVGTFVLRGDIAQKSFTFRKAELESKNFVNTTETSLAKVYSVPGQIVHVHSEKVTIRKAQPIFISANSTFHAFHGDFVQSKEQVITLIYQKLKTGDIIQGIPKVEQFFESRTTKRGRLFRDNLPNLLKGLFVKYYVYSLKLLKQGYTETNTGMFKLSPTSYLENSSDYSAQGKSKTSKLANLDFPFVALQWAVKQSFYKIQQIAVDGVLRVYRSQGVTISDKHLEIIVKQMTTKVRVIQSGQTGFFPGELVDLDFVETLNLSYSPVSFESTESINAQQRNGNQTKHKQISIAMYYEPVILGITKASLQVDSFLSSASFQQTARILSQSALFNKKDFLKGVKENVILGNLIPAGTGYLVSFFD